MSRLDFLYRSELPHRATAPSISLNGVENGGETKDAVIIGDLSEDATVKVTKDGEEIAYKLGDEITEPGEYKVR